jgi:uncharacterized protein
MLPKLLLLIFILLIAWYGVRFVTRIGQLHHAMRRAAQQATANAQRARGPRQAIVAEDLVKCRVCGAFVPAKSATRCGRADCPY